MTDPRPQLLTLGAELEGLGRIIGRKGTDERPILRIEGATDRTTVEELRGRELIVDDATVPALGEDEFWAEQLEGCTVADGSRTLGVVVRLMALPSCEALELDSGLVVPLVRDAVRSVDVEGRRIDVDAEFLGFDFVEHQEPEAGDSGAA